MKTRRIRWRALLKAMGVSHRTIRYLAKSRAIDPQVCSCWKCRYLEPASFRQHWMSYCHQNGYMTPTMQKLLGYEPEVSNG
jgi:hypothetical protein